MHSQQYADKINMHATVITDPELQRATDAYDELIAVMGEEKAEWWFDAHIREWESWTSMREKITAKLAELEHAPEETDAITVALNQLDWDSIEYIQF